MAIFSGLTALLGGGAAASGTAAAAGGAATGLSGLAGAVGTIGGLAGTALQMSGANKAAAAQQTAEDMRKAQMDLEATRSRRQIMRQALVARSEALSNATAQGAAQGSGLAGGLAQIQNEAGTSTLAVNQNQDTGNQMFGVNRRIAQAQTQQSTGSGISSLGGALVKNQQEIGRLGAYLFS